MRTIQWRGCIARINEPTLDGRMITGVPMVHLGAPVFWMRPLDRRNTRATLRAEPELVGTLDWAWTRGDADLPGPLLARVTLNLDRLPYTCETLWPEIDLGRDYTTIIGMCLGTRPAWTSLDPVIVQKDQS